MTIEDRLTSWAQGAVAEREPTHVPVERFVAPRRRPWPAMAAAVLLVLTIGAGVVVFRDKSHRMLSGIPTMSTADPAPAGSEYVVFHGLRVTIPSDWSAKSQGCEPWYAVSVGDHASGLELCRPLHPKPIGPDAAYIEFDTEASNSSTTRDGQPITVRGVPARRTASRDHIVVVVPSLAARVTITALHPAEADRLARTLTVVSKDQNGCATHVSVPPLDRVAGHGSADTMVTGSPTALVGCEYLFGYLESSKVLPAQPLAGILNRLPVGLSASRKQTGSLCWDGHSVGGDNDDARSAILRFGYADGSTHTVLVRFGFCGLLGASNGTRTGQATFALWKAIPLDTGVYSNGLRPAR